MIETFREVNERSSVKKLTLRLLETLRYRRPLTDRVTPARCKEIGDRKATVTGPVLWPVGPWRFGNGVEDHG